MAPSSKYHHVSNNRIPHASAFTIVELLIVIVVIAILAAISIVAYSGIQERSRTSAAQSAVKQAAKKLEVWRVDYPDSTPATLAEVGINGSSDITYDYERTNGDTTYCVSATSGEDTSYFVLSSSPNTLQSGTCSELVAVAGAPVATISQAGTSVSFPEISGYPDLTVYAVVEIINTTGNYAHFLRLTPYENNNRFVMDTAQSGMDRLRYRLDTSAQANMNAHASGVRTPGRHIGWVRVSSNMSQREVGYDQASANNTSAMPAGNGWTFNGMEMPSANSSTIPVAGVIYNEAHDQQTRSDVMNWLADEYSVPGSF